MIYRTFGRMGDQVAEVGFGTWGMGGWSGSDDEASRAALRRGLELGCNFLDTARAYGNGHSETLIRDALGNETRFERDKNNQPTKITLPGGAEIKNSFDGLGRLTKFIDPAGSTSSLVYGGPNGAVTEIVNPLGVPHHFQYDAKGNMTKAIIADQAGDRRTMTCEYDARGLMTAVVDPAGRRIEYANDARILALQYG